jgi:hypothetical protein
MDLLLIFICFIALIIFIIVMVSLLFRLDKSITNDSGIPRYTSRWEYNQYVIQEMYSIWLGRMFDITSKILYQKRIAISRDHYISVLILLFTILGIFGYLQNYNTTETRDFWFVVVGSIFLITFFYSQMKAAGILSPSTDINHDSEGNI